MAYSGYLVTVGSQTRFVIPAIVHEAVADMVRQMMDEDPQDEYRGGRNDDKLCCVVSRKSHW